MGKVIIGASEIQVGEELPWPIYDRYGRLLLEAGSVIGSPRQLDALLLRGIYRRRGNNAEAPRAREVEDPSSPFEQLDTLVRRLAGIYRNLLDGVPEAGQGMRNLAQDLRRLYGNHPDAMLGAVHLSHEYDYTLCHPIHCAVLCEMMAQVLGYDAERSESVVAAALSQNVGMLQLQKVLHKQSGPLSAEQRREIREHPQRAVELLQRTGVADPLWLTAVGQHHERLDGCGYPLGVGGEELLEEAQVVGLSDRYGAMIAGRSYREGLQAKLALRNVFLVHGQEFGSDLTQQFIRAIGVYPPGSFVQLRSGEVGIVIRRGSGALKPIVSCYLGPRGQRYSRAFRRDTAAAELQVTGPYQPHASIPLNLSQIWAA